MMSYHVGTTTPVRPDQGTGPTDSNPCAKSRAEQAKTLVQRNVYWVLGLGLIPIPLVDLLALTGIQVKMLKEISDLYEVPFFADKAKTVIGSLTAGLGGLSLTSMIAGSLIRLVPGLGVAVGAIGTSLFGGALTLAVGNLFALHYESGGTLLDFDADKMRAHFRAELQKAQGSIRQSSQQAKPDLHSEDRIAP